MPEPARVGLIGAATAGLGAGVLFIVSQIAGIVWVWITSRNHPHSHPLPSFAQWMNIGLTGLAIAAVLLAIYWGVLALFPRRGLILLVWAATVRFFWSSFGWEPTMASEGVYLLDQFLTWTMLAFPLSLAVIAHPHHPVRHKWGKAAIAGLTTVWCCLALLAYRYQLPPDVGLGTLNEGVYRIVGMVAWVCILPFPLVISALLWRQAPQSSTPIGATAVHQDSVARSSGGESSLPRRPA